MRSFKTYLTITTLIFSLSVVAADRSRDGGRSDSKKMQRNHVQNNKNFKDNRKNIKQKSYQGAHNSRQEVHNNKQRGTTQHKHKNHQYTQNKGFNGDYRNNRRFDNSNQHYNNNRHYNHSNKGYRNSGKKVYITHNYYKPKQYYKKWKKQNRRYWKNKYHHFYNYRVYSNDLYRYQPLRGLGHYFDRQGYGYGHWHEGSWCASYHDDRFYRNYYSYYPYQDGWRHGDGDFGIWFSFN